MEGWIKLHRKFTKWEWFNDSNMVHLFLYLLLQSNHEPNRWKGIEVDRGQIITGLKSLSKNTGISIQSIRTSLDRLISTGEITRKPTNKYSIITIYKYDDYQLIEGDANNQNNKLSNKQLTINQQSTNNQLTPNKNDKKEKNLKNERIKAFEIFWNLYDKKIDRVKCEKKWLNLSDADRKLIIEYIPKYKKATPDKQFRRNPEVFFNNRTWENEIIETETNGIPETPDPAWQAKTTDMKIVEKAWALWRKNGYEYVNKQWQRK